MEDEEFEQGEEYETSSYREAMEGGDVMVEEVDGDSKDEEEFLESAMESKIITEASAPAEQNMTSMGTEQ